VDLEKRKKNFEWAANDGDSQAVREDTESQALKISGG
jgi:hypothetical protein